MQALLSIIGLGLLGLDPVAAIIVASAIAVHSRKYKVLLFTLAFLLGTTVLGVFLSVLGQNAIDFIQSFIPSDISPLWLILNVLVIVVIIVWLTVRFTKRNKVKKEKKSKSLLGGAWQFFAMGLLFALSALTDPTFYAVIVIASETHNVFAMSGLHLLWISISQIPLLAIVVAYYLNAHNKLIVYSDKLWAAHKQKFTTILYILAILLALILLVDTIVYLTSGAYWF